MSSFTKISRSLERDEAGKSKSVRKGNDYAPSTGIRGQPVHPSRCGVPDVGRNRFVERACRPRGRREVDWKRGLSAVSQWSESNACRPRTEPAEHLHTRISMRRTHEKIIDCLRTRPLPLFASINASNRPIETVHARQPFVTAKHSRVRCTVFFPPSLSLSIKTPSSISRVNRKNIEQSLSLSLIYTHSFTFGNFGIERKKILIYMEVGAI